MNSIQRFFLFHSNFFFACTWNVLHHLFNSIVRIRLPNRLSIFHSIFFCCHFSFQCTFIFYFHLDLQFPSIVGGIHNAHHVYYSYIEALHFCVETPFAGVVFDPVSRINFTEISFAFEMQTELFRIEIIRELQKIIFGESSCVVLIKYCKHYLERNVFHRSWALAINYICKQHSVVIFHWMRSVFTSSFRVKLEMKDFPHVAQLFQHKW